MSGTASPGSRVRGWKPPRRIRLVALSSSVGRLKLAGRFMVGDVFEGDGAGRHALLDRQCAASGRRGNDSCPLQFGIVKTAGDLLICRWGNQSLSS